MDHERMRWLHGGGMRRISGDIVLTGKREIAADTWLFAFAKPDGFRYRAGQHVRMRLKGEYRFLSFASAPFEDGLTFVLRMRGSRFKRALAALPTGAKVRIERLAEPLPTAFWLEVADARPAVFLCGGIGVVPAVSMIGQALHDGTRRRLVLIHACRRPADTPFLDELGALALRHANFTYVPVMTRAEAGDEWTGETGRIDAAMIARHLPGLAGADVFISGLHGMVGDMRDLLDRMGVRDLAVRAEDFGDFAARRKTTVWPVAGFVVALLILHGGAVALGMRFGPPWWLTGAVVAAVGAKLVWVARWRHSGRRAAVSL